MKYKFNEYCIYVPMKWDIHINKNHNLKVRIFKTTIRILTYYTTQHFSAYLLQYYLVISLFFFFQLFDSFL